MLWPSRFCRRIGRKGSGAAASDGRAVSIKEMEARVDPPRLNASDLDGVRRRPQGAAWCLVRSSKSLHRYRRLLARRAAASRTIFASCPALQASGSSPGGGSKKEHGGWIQERRYDHDEVLQHILSVGADRRREISDRAQVGFRHRRLDRIVRSTAALLFSYGATRIA